MNYLQQLLKDQTVEWRKLGEVCDIRTGKGVTKKDAVKEGEYPIISGGKMPMDFIDKYNREANTVTVSRVGANAGFVNYLSEKFYLNDKCFSVIPQVKDIDAKFLFYVLKNREQQIVALQSLGGVPTINTTKLGSIEIPLPPLSVQSRIVEILDKFTALEAELEAELELRKKQYQHYREQLLNFSSTPPHGFNVIWRKLGEVCTKVCSGGTPSTKIKEYYKGNIPWLRTQDIDWKDVYDTEVKITEEAVNNSSAQLIPANCVIVAMYGATAAKACINRIPLTTNQACCNLLVDESIANYKYVYYWICREYERLRALGEGCQSNLSGKKIKDYIIPLPPLSVQSGIVEILDKFDALTNSITEGLPLEIKLRRQQYEYYREQLLDFRGS